MSDRVSDEETSEGQQESRLAIFSLISSSYGDMQQLLSVSYSFSMTRSKVLPDPG